MQFTVIELVFWTFVSGAMGSITAWLVGSKLLTWRLEKAITKVLEDEKNQEQIDRIIGYAVQSAWRQVNELYQEDPDRFVEACGPLISVMIKKVKDHIFSAQGVINRKAHAEADAVEGEIVEKMSGGMISAKLMEDHPIIGSIMRYFIQNQDIDLKEFLGGNKGNL